MKNQPLEFFMLLFMMLLSGFSFPGYAASLEVSLDKNEVEIGKYILATISYRGDSVPAEVNLSEWHESFYVDIQRSELSDLPNGQKQIDTHVRLYPRLVGQLNLASLANGGAVAKSQRLKVHPSIRNNINATPVLHSVQKEYWADQAIIITVDVGLHEKRNNIVVDDIDSEEFSVRALAPQRLKTVNGDVIRLQWMLLTPNKGVYSVDLPSIQQRGRGRFRYYLPKIILNIKPLPAYLPATIPVGELRVQSSILQEKNDTASWLVKVENDGRLPAHIEGFQTFFVKKGIAFNDVLIESETEKSSKKVSRQYQIKIPEWNIFYNNELELAYFDTTTGRLEVLKHSLPHLWNIPGYAQITSIFVLIAVIFYVGNRVDKLASKIRQWRRFRTTLKNSTNGDQLRKLILQTNTSQNLTDYFGIQQDELSQQIVIDLNELCFDNKSLLDLEQIKRKCSNYFTYEQYSKNILCRES